MEDDVFPSPAVAELMKKFVVESRQHTDSQNTLTTEQFTDNRAAQAEIAGQQQSRKRPAAPEPHAMPLPTAGRVGLQTE